MTYKVQKNKLIDVRNKDLVPLFDPKVPLFKNSFGPLAVFGALWIFVEVSNCTVFGPSTVNLCYISVFKRMLPGIEKAFLLTKPLQKIKLRL